jgi:hypothetical protein
MYKFELNHSVFISLLHSAWTHTILKNCMILSLGFSLHMPSHYVGLEQFIMNLCQIKNASSESNYGGAKSLKSSKVQYLEWAESLGIILDPGTG